MMTLLHFPLCPVSRAARLLLSEWSFDFELSEMKPWALTRDFLNINPAGTLPVLAFDGMTVCGIHPIVEYVADVVSRDYAAGYRSYVWMGTPLERAEQRRVADWFLTKFDGEVSQYLLDEKIIKPVSGDRASPDLAAIRIGREHLRYHLSYVSFLSERRKWLGGDHLSFADFAAAAQISVMDYVGEIPWNDFPECKAWYARMKSRPAFRALLAERLPGFNPPDYYANLDF